LACEYPFTWAVALKATIEHKKKMISLMVVKIDHQY
jgi:hypothetical protein